MKLTLTRLQPLAIALLIVGALALAVIVGRLIQTNLAHTGPANAYRAQVDTADGAPRSGRDPLTQPQTSLAGAASMPNGTTVTSPAPAATPAPTAMNHSSMTAMEHANMQQGQAMAAATLPNSKQTGVLASGCLADYGIPGTQCVPAYAVDADMPDCTGILKLFPQGVKVTGTDRFKLDKNGDRIACNAADL